MSGSVLMDHSICVIQASAVNATAGDSDFFSTSAYQEKMATGTASAATQPTKTLSASRYRVVFSAAISASRAAATRALTAAVHPRSFARRTPASISVVSFARASRASWRRSTAGFVRFPISSAAWFAATTVAAPTRAAAPSRSYMQ